MDADGSRPRGPALLRELNDRAALQLLLDEGPLTRTRIAELTGLSKVTASQLVDRLERRGLVHRIGERGSPRGPHAATFALVKDVAYVVGVDVNPDRVVAATADITGEVFGRVSQPTGGDPVEVVCGVVAASLESAGVALDKVASIVIGVPGLVEPASGELALSWDLPAWRMGLVTDVRARLGRPVVFENDANAAAVAEAHCGAARDIDDFVLVWLGRGIGLSVVMGGVLHRGATGAAGEIGFLPVPGAPLPIGARQTDGAIGGSFQHLVGADSVLRIAATYGIVAENAEKAVYAAVTAGPAGVPVLDELAWRLTLGVAGVSVVLDPAVVVLAGEVGRAGGSVLADKVEQAVARITPVAPKVVATQVPADPVLHGTLFIGLRAARAQVLGTPS